MSPAMARRNLSALIFVVLGATSAFATQGTGDADFQRGCFLQSHDRDPAGAAAAFDRVLANAGVSEPMRAEARTRLAECREDLASADFTRLMPPNVIAYAEISNPGEHVARLAKMMGLVRDPSAGSPPPKAGATPLGNGAFFPNDFTLSPALLATLRSFRGAAAAVTGIDQHGQPDGVLVVHPGDADLIRGLLETAVQFAEPADPIDGFKTYRLDHQAWVTVTSRLLFVSRTREQVAAAVGRLRDPKADSLASHDEISRLKSDRDGALLFAYVNGPRAAQELKRNMHGQDGRIIQAVLDLDHVDAISAAVRTTGEGLQIQARLDLMDGHHNLVYGLIRTAPCGRQSLEHVPGGVAAVALLGLNPPESNAAAGESRSSAAVPVTAMDIGREIFANLEEVALFVSPRSEKPSPGGPPIPDVGLVLIAKDAARSQALWSQLLSLPAVLAPTTAAAGETEVEGIKAQEFRFPGAPPVVLARSRGRGVLIGTRGAVIAAIHASSGTGSIMQDAGFSPLLQRLTPTSSKAVLVHAGRLAQTVAGVAPQREAERLRLAASLLADLRVCVVTDEAPTRFTLRAEVTGLPNVPEAVRTLTHHLPQPPTGTALAKPVPEQPGVTPSPVARE